MSAIRRIRPRPRIAPKHSGTLRASILFDAGPIGDHAEISRLRDSREILFGLRLGFRLRFVLAGKVQRDGFADESFQRAGVNLLAFVNVDGAPDVSFKT